MSNSIVAVSIVVIALSLLAIDLRENIIKKTFCISVIMLIIGICASLSNINPILGLIINLGVIFFIVYEGANTYKENLYFPFLLAYIFMKMSAPASLTDLPMRIVALFVGCLYILLVQIILNKGRFKKTIFGAKQGIVSMTIQRIDYILGGNYEKFSNEEIYPLFQPIIKAIYDNSSKGKVMTPKNRGIVNLVLTTEKLYGTLSNLSEEPLLDSNEKEFLYEVKDLLNQVDKYLHSSDIKEEIKKNIIYIIENLKLKSRTTILKNMVETLQEIPKSMELLENVEKESHKVSYIKNFIKPIITDSFSFKFAVKLSVSVSTIILLSEVFNITYGRWIIFPLIAIIQPTIEGTFKKSLERVLGTFIGIVLFVIIFSLVSDNMVRLNITIFLAYINLFVKKYYISTSLIAVSALGSVAMGGGVSGEVLTLRVIFTTLGCIIGLIVNKYVFYYNLDRYNSDLKTEYNEHVYELENANLCETKRYDSILKSKLLQYKLK